MIRHSCNKTPPKRDPNLENYPSSLMKGCWALWVMKVRDMEVPLHIHADPGPWRALYGARRVSGTTALPAGPG